MGISIKEVHDCHSPRKDSKGPCLKACCPFWALKDRPQKGIDCPKTHEVKEV